MAGGALLQMGWLTGCRESGPPIVTVPLAELPVGARKVVTLGDIPVELYRTSERIIARSLLCTHEGCVVAWKEDLQRYRCPCQGGWFDADGQPIQGPVTKPLVEYPVVVANDALTVTKPA
jgi:Rieske Fe-S protein